MRIIDLTMPIAPHFRWRTQVSVAGDIAAGDQFRVTRLDATCHGFSHVDAQAHILANAPTIEQTPLERVVGACRVLRLEDVQPEEEIGPDRLAAADPGGAAGEILLLAAGWDRQRDSNTPEFWRHAPG
ncbi:cyclase family protein [Pseudoroseomonas wenyumeiae]